MQNREHKVKGKRFSEFGCMIVNWICFLVYLKCKFASTYLLLFVLQLITQVLNMLEVSLCKPVMHKLKILGGENLNIIN